MAEATYTLPSSPAAPAPADTEGTYVHNDAMVEEAVGLLIEWFRKPRWVALLQSMVGEIQEAEDAVYAVLSALDLDTAVDDVLDKFGRLVGELRQGRSNDDYRAAVRVRILVNSSDGKLEQLIAIARGLVPTAVVSVQELYPAALRMYFSTLGTVSFRTVERLLHQAKPAGVRLNVASGVPTVGAVDGDPLGGTVGAVDGSPAGFTIGAGT